MGGPRTRKNAMCSDVVAIGGSVSVFVLVVYVGHRVFEIIGRADSTRKRTCLIRVSCAGRPALFESRIGLIEMR